MSTRTAKGELQIRDTFHEGGTTATLTIGVGAATIFLSAEDPDTDQRVHIALGPVELDELAAEILRIREERSI